MIYSSFRFLFFEQLMHTTKIFQNGNSQAVRIPADLAFPSANVSVTIERIGDELRIRPIRQSLANAMGRFAAFSPEFMAEGRGEQEQDERGSL
jgi:antitoxin VapB